MVKAWALLGALALCGCKSREADFTVVSTNLVMLDKVETARGFQNPSKIEAEVFRHWIFFFPLGKKPTIKDALDQLLRNGGGDVAVDAIVWDYSWYIPFMYGRSGWRVEGRVLNTHMRFGQ